MREEEAQAQAGFSLIEVMVAVAIATVIMAVALPDFSRAMDRAYLWQTTCQVVGDLRDQQARAYAVQAYQEVRFAPFANYYELYSDGIGYTSFVSFAPRITYEDGYLHLSEPTVRFNLAGDVSESGKIGFVDPEGDKQTIIICLQSGELHFSQGLAAPWG